MAAISTFARMSFGRYPSRSQACIRLQRSDGSLREEGGGGRKSWHSKLSREELSKTAWASCQVRMGSALPPMAKPSFCLRWPEGPPKARTTFAYHG